jgi:hypothetical protein
MFTKEEILCQLMSVLCTILIAFAITVIIVPMLIIGFGCIIWGIGVLIYRLIMKKPIFGVPPIYSPQSNPFFIS